VVTALAYHWHAALDLPQALPALIKAASHAMASYAPAEALRHLERALQIWPQVPDPLRCTGLEEDEVSRRAAEAAYQSGDLDRSRALLADALATLPPNSDPVRRALLLERYAAIQLSSGWCEQAVATLRDALALLPESPANRPHALVLAALAAALTRGPEVEEGAQVAKQAVAAANGAGAKDVQAEATITLGVATSYLGAADAGVASLRAGLALSLEHDMTTTALRGYTNLSDVLELLGRHQEAAQTAAEGRDLATRVGLSRTWGSFLMGNQAESLLRLGAWDEAEELTGRGLGAMPEGVFAATLLQLRAELCAVRGRYEDAARDLRNARRIMGTTKDGQFTQPMCYTDALIALGCADLPAATDAVEAGLAVAPTSARYTWPLLWIGMRVAADEATLLRDRREPVPVDLTARCAELAASAEQLATPAPPWAGFRALLVAEQARADGDAEPEPWAQAVAAWETAGQPHPLAYALLRMAEAHTRAGQRDAASRAVQKAHTIADRLRAAPITAEAAALSRRARLSLTPDTPSSARDESASDIEGAPRDLLSRYGLTAREREVLSLLADGKSNPEIGRALCISTKTASVHVSNILAKLGVSGRVEAAAVVHRLGG
jgi:DNA-binding CsgD family transcriptional regulator